ncbi:HAD family hydrolase [Sphingomonas sp. FW199]|uniref:HAD family hydrolase n=1 Tax=Sphingomonas sp. FW199 TaxID=3400217 RepID=UPI003CE78460
MKPLLICDCDEVLLHMVRHFADWLDRAHQIDFVLHNSEFGRAMRRRSDGMLVPQEQAWDFLGGFFTTEIHSQTPIPGAIESIQALAKEADIVILTNLIDDHRDRRIDQLARHGLIHRVETNQGGKGHPVRRLMREHGDPVTVFVDDLAVHHQSVAEHAPLAHRLHLVGCDDVASTTLPAPHAHARIDRWDDAMPWIRSRFAMGHAVPA